MECAERPTATTLDRLVAVCVWSYADLLRQFDQCPLILSEAQAEHMYKTGQRHLQTWASLRSLSAALSVGKIPNRNLWMILPKLHHLKRALQDARVTRINPHTQNLLAAESWIGFVGRMARILGLCVQFQAFCTTITDCTTANCEHPHHEQQRTAHRTTVSRRTLQRYRCRIRFRLLRIANGL